MKPRTIDARRPSTPTMPLCALVAPVQPCMAAAQDRDGPLASGPSRAPKAPSGVRTTKALTVAQGGRARQWNDGVGKEGPEAYRAPP